MSTYQDRARLLLEDFHYKASGKAIGWEEQEKIEKALSELASIVEEEIIGKIVSLPEYMINDAGLIIEARNQLRREQRDQLSNRSKSDE